MPLHLGRLLFKFTLPLDILDAKDSHSQHYGQEGKRKSPLCAGVSDFFALICGGERGHHIFLQLIEKAYKNIFLKSCYPQSYPYFLFLPYDFQPYFQPVL